MSYFFSNLFHDGLVEDCRIFIPASAFNLSFYVVLIKVYEENPASHRYIVGKGKTCSRFLGPLFENHCFMDTLLPMSYRMELWSYFLLCQ